MNAEQLLAQIEDTYPDWNVTADGVQCTEWTPRGWHAWLIPFSVFERAHPALPALVRHCFDYQRAQGRLINPEFHPYVSGVLLAIQLKHLCQPEQITDIRGITRWLYRPVELVWHDTNNYVTVVANTYQLASSTPTSTSDPIVTRYDAGCVHVTREYMDTYCPDWAERYRAGQALGLSEVKLAQYACRAPATIATMPLPGGDLV